MKSHCRFNIRGAFMLLLALLFLIILCDCGQQKNVDQALPDKSGQSGNSINVKPGVGQPPVEPQPDTSCTRLNGKLGMSQEWQSGWIDLVPPMSFRQGDRLELTVVGSAQRITVRLLEQGVSADSPSGIDGSAIDVPRSGTVTTWLQHDHPNVKQISVHGGPNPWGLFNLGENNGAVALNGACVYHR